jgi:hypothetical protein
MDMSDLDIDSDLIRKLNNGQGLAYAAAFQGVWYGALTQGNDYAGMVRRSHPQLGLNGNFYQGVFVKHQVKGETMAFRVVGLGGGRAEFEDHIRDCGVTDFVCTYD